MIGERIKEARLALGYSAEQVAAFLNVSPATVYRYENGDISKLPSKFIKPLADYLCVSPSYIMGWSDESSNANESIMDLQFFGDNHAQLSPDESKLLGVFRSLPQEGKQYIQKQLAFAAMEYLDNK